MLSHESRIHAVEEALVTLGYVGMRYSRVGAYQPDECDVAFLIYPAGLIGKPGGQNKMFRCYVHNELPFIFMRTNVPEFAFGNGKTPFGIKTKTYVQTVQEIINFMKWMKRTRGRG